MTRRAAAWILAGAAGPACAALGFWLHDRTDLFEPTWGRWAPAYAQAAGAVTRHLPWSLAEVGGVPLAVALVVGLLVRGVRRLRSGANRGTILRSAAQTTARILTIASAGLASFYLIWGYAAHRSTVATHLGYAARPATVDELGYLVDDLLAQQNDLRGRVSEVEGVATVQGGVPSALGRAGWAWRRAGKRWPIFAGDYAPPKPVFLSPLLSAVGLLGIYTPYTGEPNVNVDAPLFALPFSACHEMAHQRGFAREDEANFLSYMVARDSGDTEFQYAATFFAAWFATLALAETDPEGAYARWSTQSAAVTRDRAAWRAWSDRTRTAAGTAARAVNDGYLKTQGATDGVRSYGRMVDLLLAERRVPHP